MECGFTAEQSQTAEPFITLLTPEQVSASALGKTCPPLLSKNDPGSLN
jgi:hypothetical protein